MSRSQPSSAAAGRHHFIEQAATGAVFFGPERHLSLPRVLAFSGGDFAKPNWPDRNLHTDTKKAQEAGLPDVIVSATQFGGHLVDLLVDLFGEVWFTNGVIETKVPKSLMLGDTLRTKAVLRDVAADSDGRTFALDVCCENQNGEPVLVGVASCRIARNR